MSENFVVSVPLRRKEHWKVCSATTKKVEDEKNPLGIHPLAYESCLSERLLMLRDMMDETNPELVLAPYKTEQYFQDSVCDEKRAEDKFAQQTPRSSAMRRSIPPSSARDLTGFRHGRGPKA